jgi:peptidyl-prolyl cis-trans isomerase-like 1
MRRAKSETANPRKSIDVVSVLLQPLRHQDDRATIHYTTLIHLTPCREAVYCSTLSTMASESSPWTHVQFETSIGTFVIELYYNHCPRSCYNLAALANAKIYDGLQFHRIVKDFIIQGGDPTGTGRGGESIYGGNFEDEISRNLKHTGAGVVAMANPGVKDSNGSQFYITLKPLPSLDGKHSIFGRIYSGMGVVQRMGMVATDSDDKPIEPVVIYKARPYRGPPPTSQGQDSLAKHAENLLVAT